MSFLTGNNPSLMHLLPRSLLLTMKRSDFEFPAAAVSAGAVPNDVVFCGKVITRRTEPLDDERENRLLLRSESCGRSNGFVAWLRSPSGRESRCRRSESSRRRYSGMFGAVKFPLQMELSDIKMRQERRDPPSLPRAPAIDDGGESCWELVRPLRRRGLLRNALFGCLPIPKPFPSEHHLIQRCAVSGTMKGKAKTKAGYALKRSRITNKKPKSEQECLYEQCLQDPTPFCHLT
ncbi:hypothetical protein Fmac_016456 [Flemingia macrophylla]|uniref:Uncharacterized protein n=1 Tax=Flemingia macrophylla TaxID=520843 RepID=A0ABD1MHH6_9FABA